MGICTNSIKLLAKMLKDKNLSGSAITFGVQAIQGQYQEILNYLKKENYNCKTLDKKEIILDNKTHFGVTLHQDVFFKMLGFSKVESIDFYDREKPTYTLDLNKPVPESMHEKYDFVYDGGTMEHCFNVKEVLSNAVRLVKKGGYVLHSAPMTGYINHGFYQFSPTLFFDFYAENGFKKMEMKILVGNQFINFTENFIPKDFAGQEGLIFFIAKKSKAYDEIKTPIQSAYKNLNSKKKEHIQEEEELEVEVEDYDPYYYKRVTGKAILKDLSKYLRGYLKFIKYRNPLD
ncbi:MAG: hypothetical protein V2B14_02140 [bacterium]